MKSPEIPRFEEPTTENAGVLDFSNPSQVYFLQSREATIVPPEARWHVDGAATIPPLSIAVIARLTADNAVVFVPIDSSQNKSPIYTAPINDLTADGDQYVELFLKDTP